jgi:hypothetical protein
MMYFVSMQLDGTVQDDKYLQLKNQLEALGPWSNRLGATWLVESNFSARRLRDLLKPHLHGTDRLLVGEFNTNWAGYGMGSSFPDWMGRRSSIRNLPDD